MRFSRSLAFVSLSIALAAPLAPSMAASPAVPAANPTVAAANAFASRQAASGQTLLGSAVPFADFGGRPAIVAFYAQDFAAPDDGQINTRALGYLFLGASAAPGSVGAAQKSPIRKILIGSFEPEGGAPAIDAVFLANPQASAKRLFVALVSHNVNHRDTVQGTLRETFVFDASDAALAGPQLPLMKDLSRKVDGGCECDYGKGVESVKFKTARDVRAGLRALGY